MDWKQAGCQYIIYFLHKKSVKIMQISLSSYSFSSVQLKYRYSLSSGYNSSIKCYQILILLNLSLYFFFLNVTYMYPIHPLISDNDEATLQQTDGHLFRFSIYFFNRPIKFRIDEQIVIFKIVFFSGTELCFWLLNCT